jgi:hypothetical protein
MKRNIPEDADIQVILPESGFVQLPRATTQNEELTMTETCLLVHLCSYPPTWKLKKQNVAKRFRLDRPGTFNRAWKGLQDKGYIISKKVKNSLGHFKSWKHTVYAVKTPSSTIPELGQDWCNSDTNNLVY